MKTEQFKITVLPDIKFNQLHRKLPYMKKKDLADSLGFANIKKGEIFVRRTGVRGLDEATIQHEINHLLDGVKPGDEKNIRYKKGRDIFAPVGSALLSMVPGVGPPLAALAQAGYTGYKVSKDEAQPWQIPLNAALAYGGSKMAQGLPGYTAGIEASKAAGGGWLGQTLTGMQGLSGLTGWGALAQGATPSIASAPGALTSSMGKYAPLATSPKVSQFANIPALRPGGGFDLTSLGPNLAAGANLANLPASLNTGAPVATGQVSAGGPQVAAQVGQGPAQKKDLLGDIMKTVFGGGDTATGGMNLQQLGKMLMTGSGLMQATAEAPELRYDPKKYVKEAKETMEKYNLTSLPQYAQEEARVLVELPIEGPELEAKVDDAFARVDQDLERSRETQIQAVNQRYSQAGASGDTQQAEDIARINQYIDGQKVIARGEARANVLAQAYQVKSNALQTVMQAGEFDNRLALEVATIIGREDELRFAIENEDYASFQETMSDIFGMGMQSVLQAIMRRQFPDQFAVA